MLTVQEVENAMATPTKALIDDLAQLDGDILILGVGGKMGPSLAKLAQKAVVQGGLGKKVYGVSRFSSGSLQQELEAAGIETIAADLLKDEDLLSLPNVKNIIYMAGNKFGTTGNEHFTWAMNAFLPGRVAEKFANSRIVVFSTGNVYPLTSVRTGGAKETDAVGPVGEYAQSCLGRERVFTHFSHKNKTPMLLFRLNYAIDMRYGVLLEIAKKVNQNEPIDLSMGHANVIWQGDANRMALQSLLHCNTPPSMLNITGPETVSIKRLAEQFGELFQQEPVFVGEEQDTALLSNAAEAFRLFGYPYVSLQEMIEWTATWVINDGETINKPTHFQERKGAY
ncbi:epimerase [Pontibacillus yanchengensis]|uniref:Epimerase n=1 Tax=Pontibacillus yanchengensis TaxID=462910 RepID=A0ACC7VGU6_9BACI|nr:epimerase [Pontibacillus yanchengensis]MYL53915.1 epimerase [Pontibacillus yanchengensis]